MLPLAALPAIIGGVQATAGVIGSLLNKRPEYETPAAQKQSLALAQLKASSNLPTYAQTKADIGTVTGNMITAAREAGNPSAVIGQIQGNANKAMNELNMQDAMYRDNQQQKLQKALETQANYQDQEWQMNKFAPYADRKKQMEDIFGAGVKNLTSGVDSMNMLKMIKGYGEALPLMSMNFGTKTQVPNNTMLYGSPNNGKLNTWG